jgi:hypothetical protein
MLSDQYDNLYQAGMAFAAQLRLIGEHEAAHDIETFVIQQREEHRNANEKTNG